LQQGVGFLAISANRPGPRAGDLIAFHRGGGLNAPHVRSKASTTYQRVTLVNKPRS
jgi:hypothetical protein